MASRPSTGRIVASFALTFGVLALGWLIIYDLAVKPLRANWAVKTASIASHPVTSAVFWRDLVSILFDFLIIIIGVIGTWWVLASLVVDLRGGPVRAEPEAGERFTRWQRVQHWWMVATFVVCAITGYAAHYNVLAPRPTLLTIHVASGLAMGVLAVTHATYYGAMAIAAKARGESLRERFPMLQIYSRTFIRWLVQGLTAPFRRGYRPGPYGKYDPEELFEYWGVYWGMAVLGIPGVIIAFKGPQVLSGLLWVMHFKEAALAVSFILMVHITYAHLRPSVFPLDKTIITGRRTSLIGRGPHAPAGRGALPGGEVEAGGETPTSGPAKTIPR